MKPNAHNKGNNPLATAKNCDRCGLYLPIGPDGKFAKQHNSFDGYMNTCQKCRRIQRQEKVNKRNEEARKMFYTDYTPDGVKGFHGKLAEEFPYKKTDTTYPLTKIPMRQRK